VIERRAFGDVLTAFADSDHEFDFEMQVGRVRGIANGGAVAHQRICGFGKKDGRLALGVVAHFAHVVGVVAANAEYATDGELRV